MNLPSIWRKSRMPSIFDNVDSVFGNLWSEFDTMFKMDHYYELEDGKICYEVDCPGFNKENLNVEISEGTLKVSGSISEGSKKREILKKMS
jgi:HSP20 family molecular chaperone IbpA